MATNYSTRVKAPASSSSSAVPTASFKPDDGSALKSCLQSRRKERVVLESGTAEDIVNKDGHSLSTSKAISDVILRDFTIECEKIDPEKFRGKKQRKVFQQGCKLKKNSSYGPNMLKYREYTRGQVGPSRKAGVVEFESQPVQNTPSNDHRNASCDATNG